MQGFFDLYFRYHSDPFPDSIWSEIIAHDVTGQDGDTAVSSRAELLACWHRRQRACAKATVSLPESTQGTDEAVVCYVLEARLVAPLGRIFPLGQPVQIMSVAHATFARDRLCRFVDPWEVVDDALLITHDEPVDPRATNQRAAVDMEPERTCWAIELGLPRHLARIAGHLLLGTATEAIADQEALTVASVRSYVRNLYVQMGVSTRAEAVCALVHCVESFDTTRHDDVPHGSPG